MAFSLPRLARSVARSPHERAVTLGVFLVLSLGASVALAHEAWRSGRAQRAGAERALREYARFAALTYRQRVQARVYTAIIAVIRPIADPRASHPAGPLPAVDRLQALAEQALQCRCGPALEPSFYFRVEHERRDVTVAGDATTPRELAMLGGLPDSIAADVTAARPWEYATLYDVSGRAPRILVLGLRLGPNRKPLAVYGFGVPAITFYETMLRPPATAGGLLALTPAESVPNDSVLSVTLANRTKPRFIATSQPYGGRYVASVPFTAVAGFTAIEVALNPHVAPRVLIGGDPPARLPVLVSLLLLCAVLLTTTIVLAGRAIELARIRSEFVANVSHELRTPLAQVLLFSETLSYGRMSTRREVRRAADIIVGETRRLMQLVDNVLLFGRGERRPVPPPTEAVLLAPLVREVLITFSPLAAAADATVTAERLDDCVVPADRAELRQLLLNLLDNAVKYGPRGQTVAVGLAHVGDDDRTRARIWVQDEGPGIPDGDRQRVWEPFVRLARDVESQTAGSGIGLSVVHQIVRRHRGAVRVESAPSGGACIVVDLPCVTPR